MTPERRLLVDKITALGEEALSSGEGEAASVLYGLAAAMCACSERQLMNVVAKHAQSIINRITASRN